MVARMHPRSGWTMSLFTSTLAFSFLIVGVPHVLPCPVPPRPLAEGETYEIYTDQDGRKRRRRIKVEDVEAGNDASVVGRQALEEARRRARECPVPKPGGLVGQIMGFKSEEGGKAVQRELRVEPIQRRRRFSGEESDAG